MLEKIREAIFQEFGMFISDDDEKAKQIIRESTYLGSEDPGEWAPDATAVIHCESGVPSGDYETHLLTKWFRVSDRLETHYVEHINGAVIAVYPVENEKSYSYSL